MYWFFDVRTIDAELQTVLELLQADEALPEKYRDHALVSNWVGHRDCHIKPDLVLIYKKTEEGELLILKLCTRQISQNPYPIRLLLS